MAPSNETGVVRSIVKAVYKHYPKTWHMIIHGSPFQKAGVPDVLFCIHGQFFAFEVKHRKAHETADKARARTSLIQQIKIQQIRDAEGTAATVLNAEESLDIIRDNLNM